MKSTRRSFLGGVLSGVVVIAAPSGLAKAATPTLWGDGKHDDTEALQHLFDGRPVYILSDKVIAKRGKTVFLSGGEFLVSKTIHVSKPAIIKNCQFLTKIG